jgi:AraC family transcriptional regulator
MGRGILEPLTAYTRLDESSAIRKYRELDRFSILGVETTGRLAEAIQKTSNVRALLLSISLRSVPPREYWLKVDGKVVSTGNIPAYRANVIDLAAEPAIWGERGILYTHFHLRRATIDEVAADLGYARVGEFRGAVAEEDAVLAQIARSVTPFLGRDVRPSPLALDQLELILAAHVMKQYADSRKKSSPAVGGLAAWQRGRATELLRENLDGAVRLADLARECELSVSHFARSFKATFGVTSHQWLTARRIERAKELLALTNMSLADVASHSGFGDQAAFTRTFHRDVGAAPGQWRREHKKRPDR